MANQTHTDTTGQSTQSRQDSQQGHMATSNRSDAVPSRSGNRPQDRELTLFMSPFTLLQRFFSDDMTSLFDDLSGRRTSSQTPARAAGDTTTSIAWMPRVDVVQQGNELVVRADLPGVKPDEISVEIGDDSITISGQRQQEQVDENGSVYRYERVYGAFLREIPLPPGAMTDKASASFKNGVLEVKVPAPPEQVSRGRRVEIADGEKTQQANQKDEASSR